jgi:hypothetical protein
MALNLYRDVYASGSVPQGWTPRRGAAVKYPVRNRAVLRELRRLRSGRGKRLSNMEILAKFTTLNTAPVG